MKKFVVTWSFIRHIHRHREYYMITEIIEADDEYMADFNMLNHPSVKHIRSFNYSERLKSYTDIETLSITIGTRGNTIFKL